MITLPPHERPRERLFQNGVDSLSLCELIAILLGTGTKDKSVLVVAQDLVSRFVDLRGLLEASIEELMQVKGVGKAKAVQLKAAFGIALKNAPTERNLQPLTTAQEIFDLVKSQLSYQKQEMIMVVLKDTRGCLLRTERVGMGTLSEVLVHPREVFYPAVRHKAKSLVVVHNHPSGDPTPSTADLKLTRRLIDSGRIMGIGLDDHVIIGDNRFVSLKAVLGPAFS